MYNPVNRNKIVIISFFLISAGFADDELNNLINDEYENMSNRTSLDYHSKVVQVWHDSAWTNKAKAIKNYDENGYLYQKDLYKYRNDEWELKVMASFENMKMVILLSEPSRFTEMVPGSIDTELISIIMMKG